MKGLKRSDIDYQPWTVTQRRDGMEPTDPERESSLSDEWDVNDFAKRMNSGEFNDNLYGRLLGLSVQQLEDLVHVLCGR